MYFTSYPENSMFCLLSQNYRQFKTKKSYGKWSKELENSFGIYEQKNTLTVSIRNLETTSTAIPFFSSLKNFTIYKMHDYVIFQKRFVYFEVEHKICLFRVRGVVYPLNYLYCS